MEAVVAEERQIVEGLVEEIDGVVSNYLTAITDEDKLKDARTKLTALVKKYVRDEKGKPSGNYRLINNVKTATDLMDAITKFVGGNAE